MSSRRRVIQWLSVPALACAAWFGPAVPAWAQANSQLRFVVPYPPGGGSDRAARILAEALQPRLGNTIVVENITGAGGRLAMRQIAGQGDTNVLVFANPALMVVAPLVYKNNGYDPERDFQPVAQISTYEFAAAVGGAVPVREFNHLMAWMKANPEAANVGVPATGSLPHFFALMAGGAARVPVQVIGYKGSAPLATDLMGGHVPAAMDTLEALLPLHEAGKLRILATSGSKRSVNGIPTFSEAGLNLSANGWNVVYAKTGMPAATVERLAREIAATMAQEKVRQQFIAAKAEPVSADLADTRRMLHAFKAQWGPAVRAAGLQFE